MDSITVILQETTSEVIAGGLIGTVLDTIFPPYKPVTRYNFLQSTIEILGQFTLNGILVAEFYKMQASRGFPIGSSPSGNIVLNGIALFVMQDDLLKKFVVKQNT